MIKNISRLYSKDGSVAEGISYFYNNDTRKFIHKSFSADEAKGFIEASKYAGFTVRDITVSRGKASWNEDEISSFVEKEHTARLYDLIEALENNRVSVLWTFA